MDFSGLRPRVTSFGLVMVMLTTAATAADLDPGVNLFFVKRSNNINEVHYDAVVDRDLCIWKDPYVDYYWRDLAEGDLVYNRIMPWEPPAYGFDVVSRSDTEIEIRLRPFESADIDRPITARLSMTETGCHISTTITICGTVAEFQSAYIKVSGFLNWSYAYFDILGYKTGKRGSKLEADRLAERFEKNDKLRCQDRVKATHWQSGVVEKGLQMGRIPMRDGSNLDAILPEK
jgi:hypothetical protein